jgi:hypothetical protein
MVASFIRNILEMSLKYLPQHYLLCPFSQIFPEYAGRRIMFVKFQSLFTIALKYIFVVRHLMNKSTESKASVIMNFKILKLGL